MRINFSQKLIRLWRKNTMDEEEKVGEGESEEFNPEEEVDEFRFDDDVYDDPDKDH